MRDGGLLGSPGRHTDRQRRVPVPIVGWSAVLKMDVRNLLSSPSKPSMTATPRRIEPDSRSTHNAD